MQIGTPIKKPQQQQQQQITMMRPTHCGARTRKDGRCERIVCSSNVARRGARVKRKNEGSEASARGKEVRTPFPDCSFVGAAVGYDVGVDDAKAVEAIKKMMVMKTRKRNILFFYCLRLPTYLYLPVSHQIV